MNRNMLNKLCCNPDCRDIFAPSSGRQGYCPKCRGTLASRQAFVLELRSKPCSSCRRSYPPAHMVIDRGSYPSDGPSVSAMVRYVAEAVLRQRLATRLVLCLECHRELTAQRQRELERAMHQPQWTPDQAPPERADNATEAESD